MVGRIIEALLKHVRERNEYWRLASAARPSSDWESPSEQLRPYGSASSALSGRWANISNAAETTKLHKQRRWWRCRHSLGAARAHRPKHNRLTPPRRRACSRSP